MDPRSVETVDKLVEIMPRPRKKRFFCLDCGKDYTDLVMKIRNAQEIKFFRCSGCGRRRFVDPGMIAYALAIGRRDAVKNPRRGGHGR